MKTTTEKRESTEQDAFPTMPDNQEEIDRIVRMLGAVELPTETYPEIAKKHIKEWRDQKESGQYPPQVFMKGSLQSSINILIEMNKTNRKQETQLPKYLQDIETIVGNIIKAVIFYPELENSIAPQMKGGEWEDFSRAQVDMILDDALQDTKDIIDLTDDEIKQEIKANGGMTMSADAFPGIHGVRLAKAYISEFFLGSDQE